MALFLGIDGGGSKTACLIGDERSVLGAGTDGGAAGLAVGRGFDLVTFDREFVAIDIRHNLVILDDKNFFHVKKQLQLSRPNPAAPREIQ